MHLPNPTVPTEFLIEQQKQHLAEIAALPIVRGYRYGKAPKGGYSKDHRDGSLEAGISMAWIEGEDSAMLEPIYKALDRPKVFYEGRLHSKRGADGEALLLDVVEIKDWR